MNSTQAGPATSTGLDPTASQGEFGGRRGMDSGACQGSYIGAAYSVRRWSLPIAEGGVRRPQAARATHNSVRGGQFTGDSAEGSSSGWVKGSARDLRGDVKASQTSEPLS
eukprot:GGOE01007094.1.p1 GENE.GGOE01007094.1~~GGOE01007094.1.p1  ORF type:complete len:110 (+),score=0.99 GGOE01007094.1:432-761(+)